MRALLIVVVDRWWNKLKTTMVSGKLVKGPCWEIAARMDLYVTVRTQIISINIHINFSVSEMTIRKHLSSLILSLDPSSLFHACRQQQRVLFKVDEPFTHSSRSVQSWSSALAQSSRLWYGMGCLRMSMCKSRFQDGTLIKTKSGKKFASTSGGFLWGGGASLLTNHGPPCCWI